MPYFQWVCVLPNTVRILFPAPKRGCCTNTKVQQPLFQPKQISDYSAKQRNRPKKGTGKKLSRFVPPQRKGEKAGSIQFSETEANDNAIINYSIKMLAGIKLSDNAKKLASKRFIHMAALHPYLLHLIPFILSWLCYNTFI